MVPAEDVDGILLMPATLRGIDGRDTSGTLVLDTGAGALAIDPSLARALGVADSESLSVAARFASRSLPELRIGTFATGPLSALLVDMRPVWSAIDRRPLGLLGQSVLGRGAIVIDPDDRKVALIPAPDSVNGAPDRIAASRLVLGAALTSASTPIPIRIGGDGKILVTALLSPPAGSSTATSFADSIVLVLDTGATKCVLFEDALATRFPGLATWPSMRGLSAPTLFGAAPARIALLRQLTVLHESTEVARDQVDAILTRGALSAALERVIGEPVHGLLGGSYLRHFRVAVDYGNGILWLTPRTGESQERPYEYCQPGLQIERWGLQARVAAVVEGSPAERARIRRGDEVIAVNQLPAAHASVLDLSRALEGPPGTRVRVRLRKAGGRKRSVSLRRRWLLPGA